MRKITDDTPLRAGIIPVDLTQQQLSGIGLVSMCYNEAEILIDWALSAALGLGPQMAFELTTRLSIEAKIELLQAGVKDQGAPAFLQKAVSNTLAFFSTLKGFRNHIIHARVHDAANHIGRTAGIRGKSNDVMLTHEALTSVANALENLRLELQDMVNILARLRQLVGAENKTVVAEIEQMMPNYSQRQINRGKLNPVVRVPSEKEILDTRAQYVGNLVAILSASHQQRAEPFPTPRNAHPARADGIVEPVWLEDD